MLSVWLNMNINLKKVQSQSTNMIVYDLETFNIDRAIPYSSCIYRLSKNLVENYRDITELELENCKKSLFCFQRNRQRQQNVRPCFTIQRRSLTISNEIVK